MSFEPPSTPPEAPASGPRARLLRRTPDIDWGAVRAAAPPVEPDLVRRIPLDRLVASSFNPRTSLDDINELADSLAAHGLLQPVVVRPLGDERYELVAGHRRTAAARQLGWPDIPALIRETAEDDSHILTLVENLQRDDLSPREEAAGLERLLRERGWTSKQVAAAIKRSESFVSRRLRVFEDPILSPFVLTEKIPVAIAEELLPLGPVRKANLAEETASRQWGRGEVRRAIAAGTAGARRPRGLSSQLRKLRVAMDHMQPSDFSDADVEELKRWIQHLRGWATRQRDVQRFPQVSPSGRRAYLPEEEQQEPQPAYQRGDLVGLASSIERGEA